MGTRNVLRLFDKGVRALNIFRMACVTGKGFEDGEAFPDAGVIIVLSRFKGRT
jgi:hypothetical protein